MPAGQGELPQTASGGPTGLPPFETGDWAGVYLNLPRQTYGHELDLLAARGTQGGLPDGSDAPLFMGQDGGGLGLF